MVTSAAPDIFGDARRRMVERQLVRRGIADPRVLAAMRKVPREQFVSAAQAAFAYADGPLPIHLHAGHQKSKFAGQPASYLIRHGKARTYDYPMRDAGKPLAPPRPPDAYTPHHPPQKQQPRPEEE